MYGFVIAGCGPAPKWAPGSGSRVEQEPAGAPLERPSVLSTRATTISNHSATNDIVAMISAASYYTQLGQARGGKYASNFSRNATVVRARLSTVV